MLEVVTQSYLDYDKWMLIAAQVTGALYYFGYSIAAVALLFGFMNYVTMMLSPFIGRRKKGGLFGRLL